MANLERVRLQENMRKIGLSRIPSVLDNYLKDATEHTPSYLEFLDNLFREEVDAQEERVFNTKIQRAHFPYIKRIEDLDFSFQVSLNKTKILNLASLSFVENLDELGYLPLTKEQTSLFFQIVSKRYERCSLILTSNKPFNAWGELLVDSVVASAILDRLLHHATVISISGESYRLKDKKKKLLEKEPKV